MVEGEAYQKFLRFLGRHFGAASGRRPEGGESSLRTGVASSREKAVRCVMEVPTLSLGPSRSGGGAGRRSENSLENTESIPHF